MRHLRVALVTAVGIAVAQAQQPVEVYGVPGEDAMVNGLYQPTRTVYNGLPCYHKSVGEAIWLCMDSNGFWSFQPSFQRGTGNAYVISNRQHQQSPEQAGLWMLRRGGDWRVFPEVVVVLSHPEPGTMEPEEAEEGPSITRAVAVMLFGCLALTMALLSLTNSADANIRSYTYIMISTTVANFVGVLATEAFHAFLFEQLLPEPPPGGFGLGYPIKPRLKLVVTFALFVLFCWAHVFLAWKCQYSRRRLAMLGAGGEALGAFAALFAFRELLEEGLRAGGDSDPQAVAARLPTAACVALLAWGTLWLWRQASGCRRERWYAEPPIAPWPAAPQLAPLDGEAQDRCGCVGAAAPPHEEDAWVACVTGTEEEVAFHVTAFLINETIIVGITSQLKGLQAGKDAEDIAYGQDVVDKWWWAIAITLGLSLALFFARASVRCTDSGRLCESAQRLLMMSVSWCLYRLGDWQTRLYFEDDLVLAHVVSAVVITTVAVALTIICDRAADVLGRAPLNPTLTTHRDLHTAGRAMRELIFSFAFLVGIAWDVAFEEALEVIVEETAILSSHAVISKVALSAVAAVVAFEPWWRHILPKAEMTPEDHEESIRRELLEMDGADGSWGSKQVPE